MLVYLNGEPLELDKQELTYSEIVELAGKRGHPSVTYAISRGRSNAVCAGTMNHASGPLRLEEGIAINVVHTGNG